jgi:hypothetical protein
VPLPDGHVHSCELSDHSRLGAAWELQILVDGELLFGRPCVDEDTRVASLRWPKGLNKTGLHRGLSAVRELKPRRV